MQAQSTLAIITASAQRFSKHGCSQGRATKSALYCSPRLSGLDTLVCTDLPSHDGKIGITTTRRQRGSRVASSSTDRPGRGARKAALHMGFCARCSIPAPLLNLCSAGGPVDRFLVMGRIGHCCRVCPPMLFCRNDRSTETLTAGGSRLHHGGMGHTCPQSASCLPYQPPRLGI